MYTDSRLVVVCIYYRLNIIVLSSVTIPSIQKMYLRLPRKHIENLEEMLSRYWVCSDECSRLMSLM